MISLAEDKKMLGYGSLGSYSNISHFVTTRRGGCSKDAYATFNCSPFTDDEMEHVRRNQELLFEAMPVKLSELIIPHQTHGVKNLVIDRAFLALSEGERRVRLEGIDALVTDIPGCCICISTADCIPILLYDKQHQAIAAVHAGWRGTVNFIVGHTLERMRAVYGTVGEEVVACIGPGISLESFEVGDEVYQAFAQAAFNMPAISQQMDKWHINLPECNRLQLLEAGVSDDRILSTGICTYEQVDAYFSARRLGIQSGRIYNGIILL